MRVVVIILQMPREHCDSTPNKFQSSFESEFETFSKIIFHSKIRFAKTLGRFCFCISKIPLESKYTVPGALRYCLVSIYALGSSFREGGRQRTDGARFAVSIRFNLSEKQNAHQRQEWTEDHCQAAS